jgi:cell cycle checkpoint control protein RAD9A
LLSAFSKALACLSKYGEDLVIQALPDELVLSATNSAKSAYGEVTLQKFFFEKYTLGNKSSQSSFDEDVVEVEAVTGQLLVKVCTSFFVIPISLTSSNKQPLLSILRHRTVEKTVERCEISIVEGADNDEAGEDQDAFSSKLILRLYCKHGNVPPSIISHS